MDSLETPPPPFPPPSNSAAAPTAFPAPISNNTSPAIGLNLANSPMIPQASRFPFNSVAVITPTSVPLDSLNIISPFDGSNPASFSVDSGKKKRGRPRKYSPDSGIALGLSPTNTKPSANRADLTAATDSEQPVKKMRGRPPGSGKKQMNALGTGGAGFTPHVILVKAGEDIASKILAFSQQGPRAVCILSANGSVSNATLRQLATSGGTVTYEGQYEIVSLSGSFLLSENNGTRSRTGGLSVSLVGSDGQVLGGGVAGMLMAGSQVQVIVGSFIEEEKKTNSNILNSGSSAVPPPTINFGTPATAASPLSSGASSESSAENGGSPLNSHPAAIFNNNSTQPLHNMPMFHHLWSGQAQQ